MLITSKVNGDTLSATEFNQIPTELDTGLITSSGQTPSAGTLDQVGIAVASYVAQGSVFCTDSGAANSYILTQISPFKAPFALKNGMTFKFRAGNANSGASTVVACGFASQSIKKADGSTALSSGDISTAQDTTIRYDGTNFRLVNNVIGGSGISVNGQTIALDIASLTEDTSPDATADYLPTYDNSATANKKVLLRNIAPLQLISSTPASSSASVAFSLASGYNIHIFKFLNILPATDGKGLRSQISTDGGSTYPATNYFGNTQYSSTSDSVASATNATTGFTLSGNYDNDTNFGVKNTSSKGLSGDMIIFSPADSSHNKVMKSSVSYTTSLSLLAQSTGSSIYNGSTTAINNIKFFFDSGNIASGTIEYYAQK